MILFSCRAAAFAAIIAGCVLFLARHADACACCTDAGAYHVTTDAPLDDFKRFGIERLRFDSLAQLYLTEAGEDAVKGLSSISATNTVEVVHEPKQWRFTFRTEDHRTGSLTLPIPAKMGTFAADLHEGEHGGLGPALYKEWRFQGSAKGNGIFEAGFAAPARYTLILQGRGNGCDSESDFHHWRLEISGRKASYAFFGKLVPEGTPADTGP